MVLPFARSSSAKKRAIEEPVMPLPTITISAIDGRSYVVRCPRRNSDGSLCQNEAVEFGLGKLERPSLGGSTPVVMAD